MARYLEVKEGDTQPSMTEQDVQNKMLEGTRGDQRNMPRAPTAPQVLALAVDLGVDIAHVEPTGDDNEITEEDVRDAANDPSKRLPNAAITTDLRAGTPRTAAGQSTDVLRNRDRGGRDRGDRNARTGGTNPPAPTGPTNPAPTRTPGTPTPGSPAPAPTPTPKPNT